ncbi:hypothetical protein CYMTET_15010 [Cymbomonas tetramitiformis]|uniref:Uncharacterized protein n=1 Tax=Cymbomonas tetramitiformis TaxID=36881 RepID=A0AAE0L9R5_9CHLO|nr:hypothetical protein CYMTET_15010 [Cymbomonas tetramitiformis]
MAQLGAGFQVAAADFSVVQTSVPPADVQDVARPAHRPAVGYGVPTLGFGMPAMGAFANSDALPALQCFAGVVGSSSTAAAVPTDSSATELPLPGGALDWETP